jgi:hypothetical protein
MDTGMLWFDNDPKISLKDKVARAAEYYKSKYGHAADTCLVNPGMMSEPSMQSGRVQVRPMRTVLPGHLWIGVNENLPQGAD